MHRGRGLRGKQKERIFVYPVASWAKRKIAMGPACQSADLSAKTSAKAEGGQWGGSVSAIPLARGRQNRKILVSLIEKNLGAGE